jgi:hemerythrin-like domain-containing protein
MTTPHPVQISLPGQTHVAHGPHDQTGMYLMHHAFRRDLARFESAVRQTPVGETDVWRRLAGRWERFGTVLHHHHEVEDASIWPVMLACVRDDPAATATLTAMEAEHEQIDPSLAACTEAFGAMAAHPCDDHRNALDVHVTTTRAALLDHLRHEETEALPLLQRVLSDEQHAATEAAAARAYPPRIFPFLIPWVADGVPADVSEHFLAQAGPAYAVMLRLLRGRHARREQRTFRYA